MISSTIDSFTVNLVYHGKGDTNTIKRKEKLAQDHNFRVTNYKSNFII